MNKETPKGWKIYKLKDITTMIKRGVSPKYVEDSGYIVVNQKCIRNGELNLNNARMTDKLTKIPDEKFLQNGDILVNSTGVGTLGRVASFFNIGNQTQITADSHVSIARPKLDIVDSLYLKYYLQKHQSKIEMMANGSSGQLELSRNRFENMNIPVPERIEEQQEIVQVLDTMSDIIRLREECISYAQALIPALFQEMFGDINNNVTKSNVVRFRDCIELNPAKPNLKDNLNVTFLGMKDISENGQVDLSTIKMYEEVKKGFTNFENEDVLLAKITPCFENGKAAIVRNLINGYGFGSTEFYVLRPHQKLILPEYVYSIIKSHSFAEPGKYKMAGAAGQKRLPKEYVLNYKFPLPSIEMQERFAEKVREINSYIEEQQEELKNAKQMFQSLLHHAFTGELTRRTYEN